MYDLTESVYLNKGGEVVKQSSQTEQEQQPRQIKKETVQDLLTKLKVVHPTLRCKSNHEVTHICINHKCQSNSLSCHIKQCQSCFMPHLLCQNVKLHAISHLLQKFTQSQNKFLMSLFQIQDIFIENLLKRRKLLIEKYYWGSIQENYRQIIDAIYFNQKKQFGLKGKLADDFFERLKQEVYDKSIVVEELMADFRKSTELIGSEFESLMEKTIQSFNNSTLVQSCLKINVPLLQQSQIVAKTDQQAMEFISQSLWNPIKLQLLYRASEHEFQAAKFHQFCDNVPHTLTLIKTDCNKVIGGYTPITWNIANNAYAYETTNSSFLISVTHKQKMRLVNTQKAIGCSSNLGPIFGEYDIKITDRCNLNADSYCNFPVSYNYVPGYQKSQETTTLFCGAVSGNKFKVSEYEVYRVMWPKTS